MITDINQLDFSKKYTYTDYLTWRFTERVELIKGRILRMSPAPNLYHQRISSRLFLPLASFLAKQSCEAFTAPFDVRLPLPPNKKKNKIDTVIQPDITVVCDSNKLDKAGCIGAPDLVIEILSPGNTKKEMKDKFDLYQHAGIPEYWLADPDHEFIIVYSLNKDGQYFAGPPYTKGMVLKSKVLEGLSIDLDKVFF